MRSTLPLTKAASRSCTSIIAAEATAAERNNLASWLPYQRGRIADERSRPDPIGTFALIAVLFAAGHLVAEVTAAYLLEIRFQVVVPAPTNPHQFDKLVEHVIGDTIIEFQMSLAEALIVFAVQMVCLVTSGAVLRRKAVLLSVMLGAAGDLLRWPIPLLWGSSEARDWTIALSFAAVAAGTLFVRGIWERGHWQGPVTSG
jgi:uncharacterized membrane protein